MDREVSLAEVLDARERRVQRQQRLLAEYGRTLVCFTMNIAGPVKNDAMIRRGFDLGCRRLEQQLMRVKGGCLFQERYDEVTGNEAFYVVDMEALAVKRLTVELEDTGELGRLFDMDVLTPEGRKVERRELGQEGRKCLICGGPVQLCSRSRVHSAEELQARTREILTRALADHDARRGARLACRALLYEVCTTPKPGLVDRQNNGSHRDMDIFTFMDSASALWPYFEQSVRIGQETSDRPAPETFAALRLPGKLAENEMLSATGGVNTHKGAIFSVGIVCAALGRIGSDKAPERVLQECAAMTEGLTERDFAGVTAETAETVGQRLYVEHGITGVRGQMEAGLPAVLNAGLPVLEEGIVRGKSVNDAGCAALLALMAAAVDTNLIARGDLSVQQEVAGQAAALLRQDPYPSKEVLEELDRQFVERNLSPGGSADLLAICYLLYFLKNEKS